MSMNVGDKVLVGYMALSATVIESLPAQPGGCQMYRVRFDDAQAEAQNRIGRLPILYTSHDLRLGDGA